MASIWWRMDKAEERIEQLNDKVKALEQVPRVARCYICGQIGFEKEMGGRIIEVKRGFRDTDWECEYAHIACTRKQRGVEVCDCCDGKGEMPVNKEKE